MSDGYFIVKTTQGKLFTFDERCNRVYHADAHLCSFFHEESGSSEILAMIPYSQIAYIYARRTDDTSK